MTGRTNNDGVQVHLARPEGRCDDIVYKGLLCCPLDDETDTGHESSRSPFAPTLTGSGAFSFCGRPPKTFFCHSSPSVYSRSHSDKCADSRRRKVDCPCDRSTI